MSDTEIKKIRDLVLLPGALSDGDSIVVDRVGVAYRGYTAQINGPNFDDTAALTADTTMTYTLGQPGTVTAGDIIRTKTGLVYVVLSSGSTGDVQNSNAVPVQMDLVIGSTINEAQDLKAVRRIVVGDTYVNASHELELDKAGGTDISAQLQELLGDGVADGPNAATIGSIVHLEAGDYRVTSGVTMKRNVGFNLAGNARIRGDLAGVTDDLFTVDIDPALVGNSDVPRALNISGGAMYLNPTGSLEGRYALVLKSDMFNATISNMSLTGYDDGTRFEHALYMTGYVSGVSNGPTFCNIQNNQLNGGLFLDGVADGNRIIGNNIFGKKGIVLDIVNGGMNTTIEGGAITSRDGALHVINGSMVKMINVQCEQGAGLVNGTSFGGVSYMLLLEGRDRLIKGFECRGCHFGGGVGLVDIPIIVGNAIHAVFDMNEHNPGDLDFDFKITANAEATEIRTAILRGSRSAAPYDARPDRKLRVQDLGVATSGYWNIISAQGAFQNGWNHLNAEVSFAPNGEIMFSGQLVVSTTSTRAFDFTSTHWRPFTTQRVMAPVVSAAGVFIEHAMVQLDTSGIVRVFTTTAVAGDRIEMSGVRFIGKSQTTYSSSA